MLPLLGTHNPRTAVKILYERDDVLALCGVLPNDFLDQERAYFGFQTGQS